MPAPIAYTEDTLKQFMLDITTKAAINMGWDDPTLNADFNEAVSEVEIQVGVSDIANYSGDIELVRLHGRIEVWRAVMAGNVPAYDVGGTLEVLRRSQMYDHARLMFLDAEADLDRYLNQGLQETTGSPRIPYSTMLPIKAVW